MQIWKPIWIASLEIPNRTESKIRSKHHLTGDQVRYWLICNRDLLGIDDEEQFHGARTVTFCEIGNQKYLVTFIDLIDGDLAKWRLRSARTSLKIPVKGR